MSIKGCKNLDQLDYPPILKWFEFFIAWLVYGVAIFIVVATTSKFVDQQVKSLSCELIYEVSCGTKKTKELL